MATNPSKVSPSQLELDVQTIDLSKRVREPLGLTHVFSVFETTGQYFVKMG